MSKLPLFFGAILLIPLVGLAAVKLLRWDRVPQTFGWIFSALYLLWLFWEGRITVSETRRGATPYDRYTYFFYLGGRIAVLLTAVALPTRWEAPGLWIPAGLMLTAFGIFLRRSAIRELGPYYSHFVRLAENQKIIASGPYRWIRHPAYAGMLLIHAGVVVFFFNGWCLLSWAAFLVPATIVRILVEEKALSTIPGYARYAERHKRLFPLFW
jgi:protein-S-isoprenylcysteine O-methyltransferase Ste14